MTDITTANASPIEAVGNTDVTITTANVSSLSDSSSSVTTDSENTSNRITIANVSSTTANPLYDFEGIITTATVSSIAVGSKFSSAGLITSANANPKTSDPAPSGMITTAISGEADESITSTQSSESSDNLTTATFSAITVDGDFPDNAIKTLAAIGQIDISDSSSTSEDSSVSIITSNVSPLTVTPETYPSGRISLADSSPIVSDPAPSGTITTATIADVEDGSGGFSTSTNDTAEAITTANINSAVIITDISTNALISSIDADPRDLGTTGDDADLSTLATIGPATKGDGQGGSISSTSTSIGAAASIESASLSVFKGSVYPTATAEPDPVTAVSTSFDMTVLDVVTDLPKLTIGTIPNTGARLRGTLGWTFNYGETRTPRLPEESVSISATSLDLEFIVSADMKEEWLRPLETDAGKFEKYVQPGGNVRSIDLSGTDVNTFEVHPRTSYLPGMGIREWNVDKYEEEPVGRKSQYYKMSFSMSRAETREYSYPWNGQRTSDKEWKFELRNGDVYTSNVQRNFNVDSAKQGLETYTINLVLDAVSSSVFLQTLEKQGASNHIKVDDGRNYMLDSSDNLENTIFIDPPSEILFNKGLYDVLGWTATITDGTYEIELNLAKHLAGTKIRAYGEALFDSTYVVANAEDAGYYITNEYTTGDMEGLQNIRPPVDPLYSTLNNTQGMYAGFSSGDLRRYDVRRGSARNVDSDLSADDIRDTVNDGRYVYVARAGPPDTIQKIKFDDLNATVLWTHDIGFTINSMDIHDGNIYVGGSDGRVQVVDITEENGPADNGSFQFENSSIFVRDVHVEEDMGIYLALEGDPGNKELAKLTFNLNEEWDYEVDDGGMTRVTHDGEYVYAATGNNNQVRKIDEKDDFPTTVWFYDHTDNVQVLENFDEFIYSAAGTNGNGVLAQVEPSGTTPTFEWTYSLSDDVFDVSVEYPFMYIAGDGSVEKIAYYQNQPSLASEYDVSNEKIESIEAMD